MVPSAFAIPALWVIHPTVPSTIVPAIPALTVAPAPAIEMVLIALVCLNGEVKVPKLKLIIVCYVNTLKLVSILIC